MKLTLQAASNELILQDSSVYAVPDEQNSPLHHMIVNLDSVWEHKAWSDAANAAFWQSLAFLLMMLKIYIYPLTLN